MRRVVCAVLACGALACGAPERDAEFPAGAGAPARPLPESALSQSEAPEDPPLAVGAVRVRFDGTRVALEANEAPLSELLAELSRQTGLALDVGGSGIRDRRITARIVDASLVDVLSLVLRDVDFSLDLAFDPLVQRHEVTALRVVPPVQTPPQSPGRDTGGPLSGDDAAPLDAALFALLESDDPEVVLAALEALANAGDPAAAAEIEPLLEDEDPAIRDAARDTLEELLGPGDSGLPEFGEGD